MNVIVGYLLCLLFVPVFVIVTVWLSGAGSSKEGSGTFKAEDVGSSPTPAASCVEWFMECGCDVCYEEKLDKWLDRIEAADREYRSATSHSDMDIALRNLCDVITRILAERREYVTFRG